MKTRTELDKIALGYAKLYNNKIIIIKISGSLLENDFICQNVISDIINLKYVGISPVVVHGGGETIDIALKKENIKIEKCYKTGERITSPKTLSIVNKSLIKLNKRLNNFFKKLGYNEVVLSNILIKTIKCKQKSMNLGSVGEITTINCKAIMNYIDNDYIPIFPSLGIDTNGQIYNINADCLAEKLAIELNSPKLINISNVDGVLDKNKNLLSEIKLKEFIKLKEDGAITAGMIAKCKTSFAAIEKGVSSVTLINGKQMRGIFKEIFTENGSGTKFVKE